MLLYNKETEDSTRETHTEGLHKAGAVNQGLPGTSKRLTIGSSLYTQEDGISILMRYKLENRQKKDNRHQRVEIYVLRRIRNVLNNQESGDLNVAVQRGGEGCGGKSGFQMLKKANQIVGTNLFSVNFIKIKSCRGNKNSCVIGFTRLPRL